MQTKAATELYHYWNHIRGSRSVPDRNEIQPSHIRHILPDLFILERGDQGETRFRLAGTRVCALFARELRGTRFDALWTASQTSRLERTTHEVMSRQTGLCLMAETVATRADRLEAEILLLPLSSGGGGVNRIVGALSTRTRPLWLDADPVHFLQLDRVAPVDERASNEPAKDVLFARDAPLENDAPFGQTLRRVMHLRVLEGGRRD